jgi:hypothetical protein
MGEFVFGVMFLTQSQSCSVVLTVYPPLGSCSQVHQWDEDEGANHTCAVSTITETHNSTSQQVTWKIAL